MSVLKGITPIFLFWGWDGLTINPIWGRGLDSYGMSEFCLWALVIPFFDIKYICKYKYRYIYIYIPVSVHMNIWKKARIVKKWINPTTCFFSTNSLWMFVWILKISDFLSQKRMDHYIIQICFFVFVFFFEIADPNVQNLDDESVSFSQEQTWICLLSVFLYGFKNPWDKSPLKSPPFPRTLSKHISVHKLFEEWNWSLPAVATPQVGLGLKTTLRKCRKQKGTPSGGFCHFDWGNWLTFWFFFSAI